MNAEPELQFVDTNVLVYAHDRNAGKKHQRAKEIITELWNERNGCLSIQVLQELYVTTTLKVLQPLKMEAASQLIADLSCWRVHIPTTNDVLGAIELQRIYHLSFWDAMILHSASQLGCKTIWSEDLNSGQVYNRVRLINPFLN